MKKAIFHIIVFLLSVLSSPLIANPIDTVYVTPAELEPGWGFYWRNISIQEIEVGPKSYLWGLAVSPNGRYIAYEDGYGLKVMDLQEKTTVVVDSFGRYPRWFFDNNVLMYHHVMGSGSLFWFPETGRYDTTCLFNSYDSCRIGASLAPDNFMYFAFPQGYPPSDSLMYRTDLYASLEKGYIVREVVENFKWDWQPYPIFPPNSMNYHIGILRYQKNDPLVNGFHIVTRLNFKGRRTYHFPFDDTRFIWSCNTWGSSEHSPDMVLGPNADVYAYLSFRSKSEHNNHCNPPFDSATLAARDACGWYRVDTSGANLVQLVRSWTYNVGGLSITGDGETIYYGFILPDSCAAIMRMNKYGRNKEIVLRLPPIQFPDGVDNERLPNPNQRIEVRCETKNLLGNNTLLVHYKMSTSAPVQIILYDILGKQVNSEMRNVWNSSDEQTVSINIEGLPSGTYFFTVDNKVSFGFGKFIIAK